MLGVGVHVNEHREDYMQQQVPFRKSTVFFSIQHHVQSLEANVITKYDQVITL